MTLSQGRDKNTITTSTAHVIRDQGEGVRGLRRYLRRRCLWTAPYVMHEGRRWRRGCTNGGGFEISVSWAAAQEDSSVSIV